MMMNLQYGLLEVQFPNKDLRQLLNNAVTVIHVLHNNVYHIPQNNSKSSAQNNFR